MTVDVVTGEIVPRVDHPRTDSFGILDAAIRLADVIADTELVPPALRKRPDAVVAVMLTGHELGLGPMQSLQTIDLIQGQPTLSPEGMRALVLSRGHSLIVSATDQSAIVRCHRREWPADEWTVHTFTMDDAERAGLEGKENWTKYPRAMLTARATGEACRATFADVLAGVSYTAEEIEMPLASFAPRTPAAVGSDSPSTADAERATVPAVDGTDDLEARLLKLPDATRAAFRDWRRSKNLAWPPTTPDALAAMNVEAVRLEDAAKAEADAYGADI